MDGRREQRMASAEDENCMLMTGGGVMDTFWGGLLS